MCDGELSCGGNSSYHAEGKQEILVNRTKTPKLGMHMKTINSGLLRQRITNQLRTNKASDRISSSKLLSVPFKKLSNVNSAYDTMMLSTRN